MEMSYLEELEQRIKGFIRDQRWDNARVLLEEWVKRDPELSYSRYLLGGVLINLSRFADARNMLLIAHGLMPGDTKIAAALAFADQRLEAMAPPRSQNPMPEPQTPPARAEVAATTDDTDTAAPPLPVPAEHKDALHPLTVTLAHVTSTPMHFLQSQLSDEEWYLALGNTPHGPFAAAVVEKEIARGEISASTLAWREGMTEWQPWHQAADAQ
ncbi:MAG: GYF domain-containing protein [Armatimonadota bacterium]